MKEYSICELSGKEYDRFLLCLTFDSVMNYLGNIEEEPIISGSKGTIIIDQLLVAGNGRNRFIICPYNYGELDIESAKNVVPSEWCKKMSVDLLRENLESLHNSILTDRQRECIRQGIAF